MVRESPSVLVSWAVFIGVTAGLLLGLVSGYLGGLFDLLVQRLVDANIAIPGIVLALVIVAVLGPSVTNVIYRAGH